MANCTKGPWVKWDDVERLVRIAKMMVDKKYWPPCFELEELLMTQFDRDPIRVSITLDRLVELERIEKERDALAVQINELMDRLTKYTTPQVEGVTFKTTKEREMESKTFSYVQYDNKAKADQEELKAMFEAVEDFVVKHLNNGRAKSLVMTKLEEAYMWTGKSIRDDQIARNVNTAHVAERTNE
jgi:hypothetical protein